MKLSEDIIQGINSGNGSDILKALILLNDVLIENQNIEDILQNLKLLEAVFGICNEEQGVEELVSSTLDAVHSLSCRVHARLLEFSDPMHCKFKSGLSGTSAESVAFQSIAKSFAFVVLSKMSRLFLRETSIFEKALRITFRVSKMLVVCFAPVYNLEAVVMEREDGDEIKGILSQFAEVLQVIRTEVVSCEELDAVRLFRRHYMLTLLLCEFLQTTLTEFGAMLVPPAELAEEFSLVLLNPGFKLKYRSQWDYIDSVMKSHNEDLSTQCSELTSIANLFDGVARATFHGDSMAPEVILEVTKENLMAFNFELEAVTATIEGIAKNLISKVETDVQFAEGRLVILKLMAHPLPSVREKCYTCLRDIVKDSLGLNAVVKEKAQDLQTLKFVVSDPILQEIFFGFVDESEMVRKCSEELLLYLMKGAALLTSDLQKSLLDAMLSVDHPLEYHVVGQESLQNNFLIYLTNSVLETDKLLLRILRFFYSNDPVLREQAMVCFTTVLQTSKETSNVCRLIEEMHVNLPSLVYETEATTLRHRALLTAEFDIERMDECMTHLASGALSVTERRAELNELHLLLDAPALQKVFLTRDGLALLVKCLDVASNQGNEDALFPIISTLLNFYVGYPSCRTELLKLEFFPVTLVKALIFLRNNTAARKVVVQFLCLIVYADNLQVFVAENQEASMEDNVSIFTPSFANRAVTFPFEVTFFSVDSKHKDPDLVLPEEVTRYFIEDFSNFSLLRVAWNLGRYATVEAVTESFESDGKGEFQLAPLEFWRLRALEIARPIEKDLELVKVTETHEEFATTLASLSLAVEHARISGLKNLQFSWIESFEKFLNVSPASSDDWLLMRDVLNFFARVVRAFDDPELCLWMKGQFSQPSSIVMAATEELCIVLREQGEGMHTTCYACFKAVLSTLDVLLRRMSESSDPFENLFSLIGWTFQEAVETEQSFISALLQVLVTLLLSSTQQDRPTDLTETIINTCLHLTDRFDDQKDVLTEICILLTRLSEQESTREMLLVEPGWILVCISSEDQRLSATAFALLTALVTNDGSLTKVDDVVRTTLEGGALVLALSYMFDCEESCLVRQQATILACTLARYIDSSLLMTELKKFAPVPKLADMVNTYCYHEVVPKNWGKESVVTPKLLTWILKFYSDYILDDDAVQEKMKKTSVKEELLGLLQISDASVDLTSGVLNFVRKLSSFNADSTPVAVVSSGNKNVQSILDTMTKSSADPASQLNGLVSLSLSISALPANKFTEFVRMFVRNYSDKIIETMKSCSVLGENECVMFLTEMVKRCDKTCVSDEFETVAAEIFLKAVKKGRGGSCYAAASSSLVRVLEISPRARAVAFDMNCDVIVGEQMLEILQSHKDGIGSKKARVRKIGEYSRSIAILHSMSWTSLDSKKRICNSCNICYSLVADWGVFVSDEHLLVSVLKFLTSLSCDNKEVFGIFVTTIPAIKRYPTLSSSIMTLVLKFFCDLLRKAYRCSKVDFQLYQSMCDLLAVAAVTPEGRSLISKSDVIRLSSAFVSNQMAKIPSLNLLFQNWLNIGLNLSLSENAQSLMYHDPDYVSCLLDWGTSSSVSAPERLLCLEIVRNLCLGPLKSKLVVKDTLLPKLCGVIVRGSAEERHLAVVAVWSSTSNNEKTKSICRAYLQDWNVTGKDDETDAALRKILAV